MSGLRIWRELLSFVNAALRRQARVSRQFGEQASHPVDPLRSSWTWSRIAMASPRRRALIFAVRHVVAPRAIARTIKII
jgi:hypothetical protein